jgi:hypothetical protein
MGKLSAEQVLQIFRDPRPHRVIAAEHGVSAVAVHCLKVGKTHRAIVGDRTDRRQGGRRPMFSEPVRRLIAQDRRPQSIVAREYQCDDEVITRIRQRALSEKPAHL